MVQDYVYVPPSGGRSFWALNIAIVSSFPVCGTAPGTSSFGDAAWPVSDR
jgi:hypothetical protein